MDKIQILQIKHAKDQSKVLKVSLCVRNFYEHSITLKIKVRRVIHKKLGNPLYCLPQDCLLVGNPEVGNSECINHQDCLP